jgi:PRTRC genetic system protein A
MRTEHTRIGVFRAAVNDIGDVISDISFTTELPKIPRLLLKEIVAEFRRDLTKEAMLNIMWSEKRGYYLHKPQYMATKTAVYYSFADTPDALVIQVHSHNTMSAVFSHTDDADEAVTGLYMVLGRLDQKRPQVNLRIGMEGAFTYLPLRRIFE